MRGSALWLAREGRRAFREGPCVGVKVGATEKGRRVRAKGVGGDEDRLAGADGSRGGLGGGGHIRPAQPAISGGG